MDFTLRIYMSPDILIVGQGTSPQYKQFDIAVLQSHVYEPQIKSLRQAMV